MALSGWKSEMILESSRYGLGNQLFLMSFSRDVLVIISLLGRIFLIKD